jgi:hypothetical protein
LGFQIWFFFFKVKLFKFFNAIYSRVHLIRVLFRQRFSLTWRRFKLRWCFWFSNSRL